ncbi:MAG: sulfatase-like hydrolase/transferase, partial [Bacteroidales bacterium]|nr:sulfatase-like hydrolase/transferase [Bacteroidales bacterium]
NATTAFADWNIGRVIEALDNSKYKDNTIIVFWSDNGYLCGEKEHWEKGVIWEQACLTPMAIRVPGSASNGQVCKRTVNLVDLYPTLVDLCGLDNPGHLMGESLRPLIENPGQKWENPALTTLGIEYASVKNDQFRYIRFIDGSEELYNHHDDPYEFDNLASKPGYDEIKKELAKSIPTKWAPELKGRRH